MHAPGGGGVDLYCILSGLNNDLKKEIHADIGNT